MTQNFSTMKQQSAFATNQPPQIQRSRFHRPAANKFDFYAGKLIPFFWDELLPGDTFEGTFDAFCRLSSPTIVPIMDNIYLDVHFFAVPLRLVWDNFKKQMGEQKNPGDSTDFLTPKLTKSIPTDYFPTYSNADYMGAPTQLPFPDLKMSALPFRCINLIWNEYYRDQDLQNSLEVKTDDGPDFFQTYMTPLPRNKRKDYYTSARPRPQKGDPVLMPISIPNSLTVSSTNDHITMISSGTPGVNKELRFDNSSNKLILADPPASGILSWGGSTGLQVLANQIDIGTINQLREAFQMQRFLERDQRGGTRYTETVFSHFRVESPDARLQRPEFLGGGTMYININPIAQTSNSADGTTPQANLSAFGTSSTRNTPHIGYNYSSTEHQIIIGFISARADLHYQNCIDKKWLRSTKYDYFWPTFAHLGEEPVYNAEVNFSSTSADFLPFGYQERHASYRYTRPVISGSFKSSAFIGPSDISQDYYHVAQDFDADVVALNGDFVQEDPAMNRVLAVNSVPHFSIDTVINNYCTRPMPVNAIPGMADHF